MDPQERHDLKENDLQEFLANFGEFWAKHGNTILFAAVILLGVIVGYNWWSSRSAASHNAAWSSLAQAQTPQQLEGVAAMHGDPAVQTLARLRAADLYLEQAAEGADPAEPAGEEEAPGDGPSPQPEAEPLPPEAALDEAEGLYEQVLSQSGEPVYRANALLGLASVAESRQQWDQAGEYYAQADELARAHNLPAIATQAAQRRGLLDELQTPVVFAPEPPAATQPTEADPADLESMLQTPQAPSTPPAQSAPAGE